MKIDEYLDEFLNDYYMRDFRWFRYHKSNIFCHANPNKNISSSGEQRERARRMLRQWYRVNYAKYCMIVSSISFYNNLDDYMNKTASSKMYNHIFLDFDAHDDKFETIKKQMQMVLQNYKEEKISKKEYYNKIDELQDQITDLIFNDNIVLQSYLEAKKVSEYFEKQGLRTYNCFNGSNGFHIRLYFEPCHLNNYNQIVKSLAKSLNKQLNLQTLNDEVVFKNPSNGIERLPYSFNEESGLRIVPFNFDDNLETILNQAEYLSQHPLKIDEFKLLDYINSDLGSDLQNTDNKMDELLVKKNTAKEKLSNEKKLQNSAKKKYYKNDYNSLFTDLRKLVKFIVGSEYLVKKYEHYDKYQCVFHDDHHSSAIVGSKYYKCHSNNCRIDKLNYFGFIKEYFNLKTDNAVKQKMSELQKQYNFQQSIKTN